MLAATVFLPLFINLLMKLETNWLLYLISGSIYRLGARFLLAILFILLTYPSAALYRTWNDLCVSDLPRLSRARPAQYDNGRRAGLSPVPHAPRPPSVPVNCALPLEYRPSLQYHLSGGRGQSFAELS